MSNVLENIQSLAADSIFVAALQSNEELMEALGYVAPTDESEGTPARLYGTAIPLPDEDLDNVPVPYIIVTFDRLSNQYQTKDDVYESREDQVDIGVEVTGRTLDELHDLTQTVRTTILGYLRGNGNPIEDYLFTADDIKYDAYKPCYWQVIRYQCNVFNG